MSKRIAMVGAGTAGLHLGLYLQHKGVQSTIFTDKKIESLDRRRRLPKVDRSCDHDWITRWFP